MIFLTAEQDSFSYQSIPIPRCVSGVTESRTLFFVYLSKKISKSIFNSGKQSFAALSNTLIQKTPPSRNNFRSSQQDEAIYSNRLKEKGTNKQPIAITHHLIFFTYILYTNFS